MKPFSHTPGIKTILPPFEGYVQAFPTLFRVFSPQGKLIEEHAFPFKGPLEGFTVENRLQEGKLVVWGLSPEGKVGYTAFVEEGNVKVASTALSTHFKGERLHLGCHKKQEWEGIVRRRDLRELLPFVYVAGQLSGKISAYEANEGMFALIRDVEAALKVGYPEKTEEKLLLLFHVLWQGMLLPQVNDAYHQGVVKPSDLALSPLSLLSSLRPLIRSLFIEQKGEAVFFLPHLLPALHCGSMEEVVLDGLKVSLEWSKKIIRQVKIEALQDTTCTPYFRHVHSCRFRHNGQEERKANGEPLHLKKGEVYLLDRFL